MKTPNEQLHVASWGGGTNSTALIIEWLARNRPLHLILFADTGGEKPQTYRFKEVFAKWLQDFYGLQIVTVTNGGRGYGDSLEEECLKRGVLPSLAYGFKGCSVKWKRQPMDRYIENEWQPAIEAHESGELVTKLIGIDADEAHRATGFGGDTRKKPWYRFEFPLIDWGWGRDECIAAIERVGLPQPGKSACFYCPASKKQEIRSLKKHHPKLFDRAVAMEKAAASYNDTTKGLGRRWAWGDFMAADDKQQTLFDTVPDMPCGCFDDSE